MIQVTIKKIMLLATMAVVGQTQMFAAQDHDFGLGGYVEEHKDIKRAREEYIKYVENAVPVASVLDASAFFDDKDVNQESELRLSQALQGRISFDLHRNVYKVLKSIGEKIEIKARDYANSKLSDSVARVELKKQLVKEAQVALHQIAFGSSEWLNLISLVREAQKEFAELEVADVNFALSKDENLLGDIGLDAGEDVASNFTNIIKSNLLEYNKLFNYLYSKDNKSELNEYFASLLFKNALGMDAAKAILKNSVSMDSYVRDLNRQEKARQFIASVDIKKKYALLQRFQDTVLNPEGARTGLLGYLSDATLPILAIVATYGALAYSGKVENESFMYPYNWAIANFTQPKTVN